MPGRWVPKTIPEARKVPERAQGVTPLPQIQGNAEAIDRIWSGQTLSVSRQQYFDVGLPGLYFAICEGTLGTGQRCEECSKRWRFCCPKGRRCDSACQVTCRRALEALALALERRCVNHVKDLAPTARALPFHFAACITAFTAKQHKRTASPYELHYRLNAALYDRFAIDVGTQCAALVAMEHLRNFADCLGRAITAAGAAENAQLESEQQWCTDPAGDLHVHRGIDGSTHVDFATLKQDEQRVFPGFLSTSTKPAVANRLAGTGGTVLHIVVPRRFWRGPRPVAAAIAEWSTFPVESEVLITRGAVVQVIEASHYEAGTVDNTAPLRIVLKVVGVLRDDGTIDSMMGDGGSSSSDDDDDDDDDDDGDDDADDGDDANGGGGEDAGDGGGGKNDRGDEQDSDASSDSGKTSIASGRAGDADGAATRDGWSHPAGQDDAALEVDAPTLAMFAERWAPPCKLAADNPIGLPLANKLVDTAANYDIASSAKVGALPGGPQAAAETPEAALLRRIHDSDEDVLPLVEELAELFKVPLTQFASSIKIPKAKVPRRMRLKPSAENNEWLGLGDIEGVREVEEIVWEQSAEGWDPHAGGEWWNTPNPPGAQHPAGNDEQPHCFLSELPLFMSAVQVAHFFRKATGVEPVGVVRKPSALDGASGGFNVYVKDDEHVAQAVARSQSAQVTDFRILYTDGSVASGSQLMRMRIAIDAHLQAAFKANPERFRHSAVPPGGNDPQPLVRISPPGVLPTVPEGAENRFAIPSVRNGPYPVMIAEGMTSTSRKLEDKRTAHEAGSGGR